MSPYTFDTLEASKRLREAGMAEGVAEAVVSVFQHATSGVDFSELATKADLEFHRAATRADLDQLRAATKADLDQLRAATKTDLDQLRAVTIADLDQLRTTTKADLAELRSEMATKADLERFATKADLQRVEAKVDLAAVASETKAEFDTLRAEIRVSFSDFDARLSRRLLAYFLSLAGLMVSLAFGAAAFVRFGA